MPIITLLTDFGTRDAYVGELRGVLLTRAPGAVLADITHDIAPGDVRAAAYVLGRTWPKFPAGTVHLAVVDPGVGGARAALAIRSAGHHFVGPDNGLLTSALTGAHDVVELPIPPSASATFHGRDVFAPAAAALAGGTPMTTLGSPPLRVPVRLPPALPRSEGDSLVGEVVYVDRYGTLVTNLAPDAGGFVEIGGSRLPLRRTFSDIAPGELVAFVGSGGVIEIAVRDGSAAERLGAAVGASARLVRPPGNVSRE
ncbi:MAG: SAM hydrolase/SAM-dependent halogenase family protein [Gemmatimonadales bacterium]